ncbi:retention module-containing protein, partial [Halopseudomonas yangmingensis]
MAGINAVVLKVVGQVFALDASGGRRLLLEGDTVLAGEQVITDGAGAVTIRLDDGQVMDLGRDTRFVLSASEPGASVEPMDIAAIQQAIAAGQDPSVLLEATAAGPAAGGAAGGEGGGHSFVLLDRLDLRINPDVGLDTVGPAVALLELPQDQDPLFPDLDEAEPPSISIQPLGGAENASVVEGGVLQFLVSLSAPSSVPVSFTWTVSLGSASTADLAEPVVLTGTVTIPAGSTSYLISLPTFDDLLFEGGPGTFEDLQISISDVQGAVPGSTEATGLIEDNDSLPVVNLDAVDGVGAQAVEGQPLQFTVRLSGPSASPVEVNWTLQLDGSASADDLQSPISYSGSVTIPAGQLSAVVSVPTLDDNLFEGGAG